MMYTPEQLIKELEVKPLADHPNYLVDVFKNMLWWVALLFGVAFMWVVIILGFISMYHHIFG